MNRTARVTQHNLACTCGVYTSLMRGMVAVTCRCGATYDLPELSYRLDATIAAR